MILTIIYRDRLTWNYGKIRRWISRIYRLSTRTTNDSLIMNYYAFHSLLQIHRWRRTNTFTVASHWFINVTFACLPLPNDFPRIQLQYSRHNRPDSVVNFELIDPIVHWSLSIICSVDSTPNCAVNYHFCTTISNSIGNL